jgi:citrate lyase beta subunit
METSARQPVHTVYGGAHLFTAGSAGKLGALALRSLEDYAPDPETFTGAIGLPEGEMASVLYGRVLEKLRREPVEDFRIDFEDGYGSRPDAEEDEHARAAGREVAQGLASGSLPPFLGIRIKPLTEELKGRAVRTLEGFMSSLMEEAGRLPDDFVVTLPKVSAPGQVARLAELLDRLEEELSLEPEAIHVEIMVETPQAVIGPGGEAAPPALVEAGNGRVVGAHFGTYDYTASLGITAAHQHMSHPACDFARHVMQVSLAGTGVRLSDGATNILPVPVHSGARLTDRQKEENRRAVHRAWKLHYDDIRHSLTHGYYQGWDLHPAQLSTRYGAVYAFFLEGVDAAAERLRAFVEQAARATLVGEVFDDAATGQGLLNFFLRAVTCGALGEEEAGERTGLTLDELESRSFLRILENRRSA